MSYNYDREHNKDSGKQPGDPVGFNSKMGWGNVFERNFATPLDRTSLFVSYEDALAYATGGNDKRGLSGTSYPGQIITVLDSNGQATTYVIKAGSSYTSEQKTLDDAWYEAVENETTAAFLQEHGLESYTPTMAQGASIGDEVKTTRELIEFGTKSYVDQKVAEASATAVINWLTGEEGEEEEEPNQGN